MVSAALQEGNPNLEISSRTSSRHRPASFLGSYLDDGVGMDPDLMIGAAAVGHFQPVEWASPRVDVHDFGLVEDEDGEAERLVLRRMPGRLGRASVDDDDDGDAGSNVAIYDMRHSREGMAVEAGQKRRWSTRLSETIFDFGKKVKERAGSFAWRRDSVQHQTVLRADASDSSEALDGSGERSRDGDDELSLVVPLRHTRRRQRASVVEYQAGMERSSIEYLYPVEVRNHEHGIAAGESSSTAPDGRMSFHVANYRSEQHRRDEHERLAMLEREVRIAERQGAFGAARRARLFKKAWAHRTTDEAQRRASVKYRSELASRKRKEDAEFLRWSIEQDMTPLERMRSRVERWMRSVSASRQGSREDSADVSRTTSGPEDGADNAHYAVVEQAGNDEWLRDNAEAARYAGCALQSAPSIF